MESKQPNKSRSLIVEIALETFKIIPWFIPGINIILLIHQLSKITGPANEEAIVHRAFIEHVKKNEKHPR